MLVRCLAMMRGGGETRHLAWARELTALGVDVEVIAGRPLLLGGPRYKTDDVPARRVTLLRSPYARDFVYRHQHRRGFGRLTMTALHLDEEWFCAAAWRWIAEQPGKPHLVHAHALHQAARRRTIDIPVVINLPGAPNPRYYADLHLADALVADGWAADQLPARIGRSIDRVSKGVDSDRFRPDDSTLRQALRLNRKHVVLAVARLVPIKNIALLVEAVAMVRTHVPDVHLVVVGDGPEGWALRSRVNELGLTESVTFAGSIPHEDTPAFYRSADLFALSSDFDNSPNAILEAMASGLPVIATDVGGVRHFVRDPMGGAVVPRGDAGALAYAIERFLVQPDAARAAGLYNRQKASSDFSWRSSAAQLFDVYRRVIDARAGARASA